MQGVNFHVLFSMPREACMFHPSENFRTHKKHDNLIKINISVCVYLDCLTNVLSRNQVLGAASGGLTSS